MENIYSFKIKKGDEVRVLLGKDRGKTGKVMRVLSKESKILVEGVNMFKRHIKKTAQREGGVVEIVKPVNVSNVALVCTNCKKPTRVGFTLDGKTKQRVCKKCKEVIK